MTPYTPLPEQGGFKTITLDEIRNWCRGSFSDHTEARLHDIMTGEYDLSEAREDILSFRTEDTHGTK